jgi:hypothetical protein
MGSEKRRWHPDRAGLNGEELRNGFDDTVDPKKVIEVVSRHGRLKVLDERISGRSRKSETLKSQRWFKRHSKGE